MWKGEEWREGFEKLHGEGNNATIILKNGRVNWLKNVVGFTANANGWVEIQVVRNQKGQVNVCGINKLFQWMTRARQLGK